MIPRIALTTGEPAGIGPDLCLMLAQLAPQAHITLIGDYDLLQARAKQRHLPFTLDRYTSANHRPSYDIWHIPVADRVVAGRLNPANSHYVLNTLTCAVDGCLNNQFDAIVTAPVHKGVINDAGIAFSGHTEFLADYTHTSRVVMMLVGGGLRVALATTHLPLAQVAQTLNAPMLEDTIRILHADLIQKFGLEQPRILVAGLNPHAGENGYLGNEEQQIINPVLAKLRAEGMQLKGALPADTLFTRQYLDQADCVLAMYHDQGLPVLKHASFGAGVNVTLGLPIIRTSVDHGTALDLAGTGTIDMGSLQAAMALAISLAAKN